MSILSSVRNQRAGNRRAEKRSQVVVFQMQQEWFALPILAVKKVVPMNNTYGNLHDVGISLTVYQGKELLVLDVESLIFGTLRNSSTAPQLPAAATPPGEQAQEYTATTQYMLIACSTQGSLAGLPLKSPPVVRNVPESAFAPIPASYSSRLNIQYVGTLIVQDDAKEPLLFLLNPDQLIHSLPLLPG
ncbi:chemotaxis protein CheW [Oculatella sp. LEGE 06141]|uniref:chemotaxis protein CheW n=1 Tax=Oculatella sp. LEGE 06141 TaxID=1828648 RepID=UPI00187EBFC0|nr:chemotaxis protein CheW [Oculatella sp. LEGE 06141]MBE9179893.1 chemotaxis protein CheW [Oculatella sp. LEGE 06141]